MDANRDGQVSRAEFRQAWPLSKKEAARSTTKDDDCNSITACPLGQELVASPSLVVCDAKCSVEQCCVPVMQTDRVERAKAWRRLSNDNATASNTTSIASTSSSATTTTTYTAT